MNRGFSLLEILIALSILTTTLIAVGMVTIGIPSVIAHTRMNQEAIQHSSSAFLHELARGKDGFPMIISVANMQDRFEISVHSSLIGNGSAKRIESSALWNTEWGVPRSIRIEGFATDYKNASDYTCSPFLFGKWQSPDTHTFFEPHFTLPPISALAATRTHVIAGATSTSGFNDPSLFVFRTEPEHQLVRVASFDSATSTKVGYVAVAASSHYIYALSAHSCTAGNRCASLDIFSLNNTTMDRLGTIPIPSARSILYHDGRLYVGLRASGTEAEFRIFDVRNLTYPVEIGSSEIGYSVNDITTDGMIAYLATSDNSASGNKALMAFDVSHPSANMTPLARSRQAGAGISQRVLLSGNTLYLGRSSPLYSKELYLFATDDIVHELSSRDTNSSITGLVIRGFYAFILTRTGLDRWDVSDPKNPVRGPDFLNLPAGTIGSALACSDGILYVAANGQGHGRLIALSSL